MKKEYKVYQRVLVPFIKKEGIIASIGTHKFLIFKWRTALVMFDNNEGMVFNVKQLKPID